MTNRRKYDDDDGRTIADMSGVEGISPFRLRPGASKKRGQAEQKPEEEPPEPYFADKGERRAFIGGAVKAALLIALAYLAGLGLVIFLLTLTPY